MKTYRVWFDQMNQVSFRLEARGEKSARNKALKEYKKYLLEYLDDLFENGELTIEQSDT